MMGKIVAARRLLLVVACFLFADTLAEGIEPWKANPWYWSHEGTPVLLLGGSDDDNLFQWPQEKLIPQLDRIAAAGGNVVRNTMSDRKDGGFEVYPFLQLKSGKYDLSQWNPEYWNRFENFLSETAKRKIFVQIEIWDRFDYTDNRPEDPRRWTDHPYNPPNNVNYSSEETTLENRYPAHPGQNQQPFFFSTPSQRNIQPLLKVQQAFVNKLLGHTLKYDHILYCIDNETSGEEAWATYWTEFLHGRAAKDGKTVYVTEMWDAWDLKAPQHARTFDHPERYAFVDVSQNNHNKGDQHWENLQYVRQRLSSQSRPINTTKTYGADGNKFGHSDQDAIERFWRHILGGVASARFHRPDSGLGINDKAVNCIRTARKIESQVPFWMLSPSLHLITDREENEAFVAATANQSSVVIYFPASTKQRRVQLITELATDSWRTTWFNIDSGEVVPGDGISKSGELTPPSEEANSQGEAPSANVVAVLRRTNRPLLEGESLELKNRKGFVFLPKPELRRSPQPWVMYAPTLLPNYPDEHERWLHEQLLSAGVAVAGIDLGEAYGSPDGNAGLNELYRHLTEERGFSRKPCLLGRSRGGLWVSSWASENPEKVSGIAGIYPVFDLTTYPGVDRAAGAYGMTSQQLTEKLDVLNPINKATVLANQGIPIFLIHGTPDAVVPHDANSAAMRRLYEQASNQEQVQLITVDDQGHNFWAGFFTSQPMVDFLIKRAVE